MEFVILHENCTCIPMETREEVNWPLNVMYGFTSNILSFKTYVHCMLKGLVRFQKKISLFSLSKKKKKSFQSNQSRKANFLRINYQMAYVAFAKPIDMPLLIALWHECFFTHRKV